jgi:hypothetical protein
MTKDEKRHWYQVGFHATWGAMVAVSVVLSVAFAFSYIVHGFGLVPKDDCDRSTWDRCNMRILTDAKTGQQYLETTGGGIIARQPR